MKAYGGKKYDIENYRCREEFNIVAESHPNAPRNIILKTDALRRGVTFSREAMEKLQDPINYDLSISIEFQWHMVDQTTKYLIPYIYYLSDGTFIGTRVAPPEDDPYLIELADDKFFICWPDGEAIEEIFFLGPYQHAGKALSSGVKCEMVAQSGWRTFYFVPVHHCSYWNTNDECRFCDLDYFAKHMMKMGRGFKTRQTPDDIYEATCEVLKDESRYQHCFSNSGSDPRDNYAWDFQYNLEIISAINRAAKDVLGIERFPIYLVMAPQPKNKLRELYDAGVCAFGNYLETWDTEQFKLTCPGKAKFLGRNEFIKRMLDGVDIFGPGNVACGFVIGVEMAPPPYGFEDVEDALASSLEGYTFLIDKGVIPLGTNWSIEPGTHFYKLGAKQPPLEFWVRLDLGRFKLLKEFQEKHDYGISAEYLRPQCWGTYFDYQRLL